MSASTSSKRQTPAQRSIHAFVALLLMLLSSISTLSAAELMITQGTDLSLDYDANDDIIVLSLLERLWQLPGDGGEAAPLTPLGLSLRQPAVSPDGRYIVAEGGWVKGRRHLWLLDRQTNALQQVTNGDWQDYDATWHPDSRSILFVSNRGGQPGLWRVAIAATTAAPVLRHRFPVANPVVDPSGAAVLFVDQTTDEWRLLKHSFSGTTEVLHRSGHRLSHPDIREAGVVVTFLRHLPNDRATIDVLLPVGEHVVKTIRELSSTQAHPPVWRTRNYYLTIADGRLLERQFASHGERALPFVAWLSTQDPAPRADPATLTSTPLARHAPYRLRAARVYLSGERRYLTQRDLVIRDGRIAAIVDWGEQEALPLIDLGDVTVMPGLIDIDADFKAAHAARWRAAGVTTVASLPAPLPAGADDAIGSTTWTFTPDDLRAVADNAQRLRRLKAERGTRFLTDQLIPDLMFGAALLDLSWFTRHAVSTYEDQQLLLNRSNTRVTSHLAQRGSTPRAVMQQLQQHRLWPAEQTPPSLQASAGGQVLAYQHLMVIASGQSGLPPGLATVGELLTLHAHGVAMAEVLASATHRAAMVIGLSDTGDIVPGYRADLLIVDDDPLDNPATLLSPVAIVSRGRFMSIPQILEAADR